MTKTIDALVEAQKKTYSCTVLFDASVNVDVEATSPEQASELAIDKVGNVSLCHQCSRELEFGDSIGAHVYHDDEEVADTTYSGERIAKLETENRELKAALAQARAEQSNQLSGNSGTLNLIATTPPAAPVAKLEPWMVHARKLVQWRHCMSYNDSYFGESAGLLKHITTELERLMPEERLEAAHNAKLEPCATCESLARAVMLDQTGGA